VGIAFRVDSSFKLEIPRLILSSTNWNFGALLQYLHMYLPLPTWILGLCCNTYTRTYFYQLEFWGFVAIPTPVHTFTNWNFGASLQYLHLYLLLPTGILGLRCNACTHIYFYQLELWGLIAILALVLTYQLGFWGLVTILAFNTNIIIILVFLHFTLFVFITWKQ
jgi:hypothetical protein